MSGVLSALQDILLAPQRAFGIIIPNVVVSESHMDNLAITEHPVEIGAPVSDHAFLRPAELKIKAGWSPSSPAIQGVLGAVVPVSQGLVAGFNQLFNGGGDYLQDVYRQVLALQATRDPFDIITGKRRYADMLIQSIATETTRETEYSLVLSIAFKQVIRVRTQTTSTAPQSAQAQPARTSPTQERGVQTPTTPTSSPSVLRRLNDTVRPPTP